MAIASRAIIIDGGDLLLMKRNKSTSEYYTLVGGVIKDGEDPADALAREVKEETGIDIVSARLVYIENHPAPYNSQYIYVCEATSHGPAQIQEDTEEDQLNRLDYNIHTPVWIPAKHFGRLPFSTIQLQRAIVDALENGFPEEPKELSLSN